MAQEFTKLPAPGSVRLIPFTSAKVVTGIVPGKYILVVRGNAPCINMEVKLRPRIYVMKPDYWGIEVTGTLPGGFCLRGIKPYTESLPLDDITGTKGIEVIGSNKKVKILVPPKGAGGGGSKKAAATKKAAKKAAKAGGARK